MSADAGLVDAHVHLQRDVAHGQEMWEYFLGRTPGVGAAPVPPAYGTAEEYLAVMDRHGIGHANFLMFTWSGRYLRDGMRVLADTEPERSQGYAELRARIVARISANNAWAAELCGSTPRLTYFAGVDPVLMDEQRLVEELDRNHAAGAVGVKVVFYDLRIAPDDPRMEPVYRWCDRSGVPLLTEGGHTPASWGRPAAFEPALQAHPHLRLVFAHLGHAERFGQDSDADVVRLARAYGRVYADVSMRLEEVAEGSVTADEFVEHVRAIGADRVMFGSNYPISENLHAEGRVDRDGAQTTRLRTALDVLRDLPLTHAERTDVRGGTFWRLIDRTDD